MISSLGNQCIGLVVGNYPSQGVRPSARSRVVGGRSLLFVALLVGWVCGESGLAVAQIGFSHDPTCGPAYRLGRPSFASAAAAHEASPLSENNATNKSSPRFEYDVKAALLYRCLELARWPAEVSSSKDPTTIIGLLGKNAFRDSFNCLNGKTVSGRRLVVKQLSGIQKAASCQLIFVCSSEQKRTPLILQKLAGLPVLTVGETPGFTEQGGMINLLLEGKHIRLEVNPLAAQKAGIVLDAGLQISSRAAETNQVYDARGIVRDIASDYRKAVIRHEAIPDYMPAMTMEFNVRDTNEFSGVGIGDTVTFQLTATDETHWIDNVRKVAATTNSTPSVKPQITPLHIAELKPGDLLPDYELIAENGKPIRFSDFRGKAIAFTFIFTRCPLPDFCPRMDNNFAKAREIILNETNAPTNWQFLSLSFDPDFDKPDVLSSYAGSYRQGNADRWIFAAVPGNALAELAPRLDLMVNRDVGGSISHNLRTVVLDPQGRIHDQFDGNYWTPQQLAEALQKAASSSAMQ